MCTPHHRRPGRFQPSDAGYSSPHDNCDRDTRGTPCARRHRRRCARRLHRGVRRMHTGLHLLRGRLPRRERRRAPRRVHSCRPGLRRPVFHHRTSAAPTHRGQHRGGAGDAGGVCGRVPGMRRRVRQTRRHASALPDLRRGLSTMRRGLPRPVTCARLIRAQTPPSAIVMDALSAGTIRRRWLRPGGPG